MTLVIGCLSSGGSGVFANAVVPGDIRDILWDMKHLHLPQVDP